MKSEAQEHLARGEQLLGAARQLMEWGFFPDSIGRSYYALFHAAQAVLVELAIERGSHHGLWAAFGQFVTAPGLMDVRYHHEGIRLFSARSRSEYQAKPTDTLADAQKELGVAREFVAACRAFLEGRQTSPPPPGCPG
jgi:uncharacterized protein (UPF0332 family)